MPCIQPARAPATAFAAGVGSPDRAPTWAFDRLDVGGAAALTRRELQADVVARFNAAQNGRPSEDELQILRQARDRAGD